MSEYRQKLCLRLKFDEKKIESEDWEQWWSKKCGEFIDCLQKAGYNSAEFDIESEDGIIVFVETNTPYQISTAIGDGFYIDMALQEGSCMDDICCSYDIIFITSKMRDFAKIFSREIVDVRLVLVNWYSGTDEPRVF